MCIFRNQEKIKQDNIFSIMTKSLDTSRLLSKSSFIFLKNISGLIQNTYFYTTAMRNVKNEKTNKWEKQPYYTIEDRMPLGHGPKSAMIVKQYMNLTNPEMYAIWWHMGFNGNYENDTAAGAAFEKYPLALALYTADMMASRIMEGEKGNKTLFLPMDPVQEGADPEAGWQEALPLQEGT